MKNWKRKFNLTLLAIFLLGHFASAQVERTKKIDRTFEAKSIVELLHRNGPLLIQNSSDGKVHVHAELVVKADSDEAAEAVFGYFELEVNEFSDRVEISSGMESYSQFQVGRKSWIKFGEGPKIKGVMDFEISVVLQVPKNLKALEVENKYDDIEIENDFSGDLTIDLYSGKLNAKNIAGAFHLFTKYSEAKVGRTGSARLDIYDSNLWLGEMASAEIKSKYSECQIDGVMGKLDIEAYDDKWEIGHVEGDMKLVDKYSEFEFNSIGKLNADFYDSEVEVREAGDLYIGESKYTEFRFGKIKALQIRDSYDDDFRIKEADGVIVDRSKYSEYQVEKVRKVFGLPDSYDDTIDIDWVSKNFTNISLNGKYTEMEMDIEEGAQFEVNVNMKYGNFEFDEKRLDVRVWKEKDSELMVKGFVGGEPTTSTSFLSIEGYDNNVDWD